jgi:hypothetical protein
MRLALVWYDCFTMAKRLTGDQRGQVAEKLIELGNIAAGALLFGQAISGFPFNLTSAVLGGLLLGLAYSWALVIMKGGDH